MNKKFYERLVNVFGDLQILKVVEEMTELSLPLLWRFNGSDKQPKYIREKVVEEISDVLMTFESLKIIFDISDSEIESQIKFKEAKKEMEIFGEIKSEDEQELKGYK